MVDVNGRVSAQTTIKAETIVGGRKVMAGLALGSDGDTRRFWPSRNAFAIIDEVTGQRTPFVVQGGQVFINYAMIDTAFIQNLVLGMTLRSSAVNEQGLPLLEINIPAGKLICAAQQPMAVQSGPTPGFKFFHGNGVTAIDLGLGV